MDLKSYHQANLILPRLWLGDRKSAMDPEFLRTAGITTVFNATKDLPFSPLIKRTYRIPVDDNLQPIEIKHMAEWSPEIVYKVINEYKNGSVILIHCHAGMQRSAAIMAMTLIALSGHTASEIIPYIRSKRQVAFFPSANFLQSILGFEKYYFLARNGGGDRRN